MQILKTTENIFDLPQHQEAVCITTNSCIRKNGLAVMGKGIAKEADLRFNLAETLARQLNAHGNHVHMLKDHTYADGHTVKLLSFPTKTDWKLNSDLNLIRRSAYELIAKCIEYNIKKVYLPPTGCGCGNLNFDTQVKPALEKILTNDTGIEFIVVLRT